MKTKTTTAKKLDLIGNGRQSDREIFNSVMKQWRQRIGYCSLFAVVSAALSGSLAEARSDGSKISDSHVAQHGPRPQKLNPRFSDRSLLKRQSGFRLPHQNAGLLAAFAGNDDCPGKAIPGGTYTSAAPYSDSGDTSGANDTITALNYYYYYYYDFPAHGPDHVYSFTLTSRGANPTITVSASTSTYKPMVYLINGQYGQCPANTGNVADWWWSVSYAPSPGGTVTIDSQQMGYLPLGVPFYLFVDAPENDASGSGAYTIRMQDVTIAPSTNGNLIDDATFFARQQYLDFLNREPDAPGLAHWAGEITDCSDAARRFPGESFELCTERKRANTSAAFFLSPEFQNTGSFVLRVYWGTLGKLMNAQCSGVPNNLPGHCRPRYSEYIADMARVTQGIVVNDQLDPARINANKQAFVTAFVQRPEFLAVYGLMNNTQYVDELFHTTGIQPSSSDRQALINGLNTGAETRASVLFKVVDGTTTITDGHLVFNTSYGQAFYNQEFDTAFVMMEYLAYLRRNPDQAGYDFWLEKMRRYGNWVDAQMVLAFILSPEYRARFGQP